MTTDSPETHDASTPEYWKGRLERHDAGVVVGVGDFAILAALAAKNSATPDTILALAGSQCDIALRQGHEHVNVSASVILELGSLAFTAAAVQAVSENTASVTLLFPGTDLIPGQRISPETQILSQGA